METPSMCRSTARGVQNSANGGEFAGEERVETVVVDGPPGAFGMLRIQPEGRAPVKYVAPTNIHTVIGDSPAEARIIV